jgi:uncharacterized repeat protein (TIGR03803 family)
MKLFRILRLSPAAMLLLVAGLLLSRPGALAVSAQSYNPGAGELAVLHAFAGGGAMRPNASPIHASDGNFYGTTSSGGTSGLGTVYTTTAAGEITILHSFAGAPYDGSYPIAGLIETADGSFYGTTNSGGASDRGTIFKISPQGTHATVHAFAGGHDDGASPQGALVPATDGNFYGVTSSGGAYDYGIVFRMTPDTGTVTLLHSFGGSERNDGTFPYAALVQATDGNLYGTTPVGGRSGYGTMFMITVDGALTILHHFDEGSGGGGRPYAGLLEAADGNFYGTAQSGGSSRQGTVFRITPAGSYSDLHAFSGGPADGAYPSNASLVQESGGILYGVTMNGGQSGQGAAFSIASDGTYTVLHGFVGGPSDGAYPAGLVQDGEGALYGVTTNGGEFGQGTVFTMTPDGTVAVLLAFSGGPEGTHPAAALIQATDGKFYGTTASGGVAGAGTVFTMTQGGTVSFLHAFPNGSEEGFANPGLLQATDGNFYGTTASGGAFNQGSFYKVTTDGTATLLHSFAGGATDGSYPVGSLIQAADGNFYGITYSGGLSGQGTLYTLTPAGVLTVLHAFGGGAEDGSYPAAAVVLGTDGNFYGTAQSGGAFGQGIVFSIAPDGALTVLHAFAGGTEGSYPRLGIIQATDGNLYGTTQDRGAFEQGIAFKITPDGTFTVLHAFSGDIDGAYPGGELIQGNDGNFYGSTQLGGAFNVGSIYKMTPGGTVTVLHAFAGGTSDGGYPRGQLLEAADGNFYGTTAGGGAFGQGVVFRLSISLQARITSPVSGAIDADLTLPIQWTPVANAQAYYLYVGTTVGARDLVNTGEIQQTSYVARGVPGGQLVFARIWTKAGGVWRFNDSSFRTAAGNVLVAATLTSPLSGATGVDMTSPIQWTTVTNATAYYLYVGTTVGARDLVNSGETQQTSFLARNVPGGQLVFARIWTKVGGTWRFSDSTFTAVVLAATLTSPVGGAVDVDLTLPIQWTAVPGAQAYFLYLGTTVGAKDLAGSGELQQTSYLAGNVPASQMVFARIWTKAGGVWRFNDSSFTTSAVVVPVVPTLISPVDGATDVDTTLPIRWTTVINAQGYYLYLGTTPGGRDLVNSGELQRTSYAAGSIPEGRTVFARVWSKVGGVWRYSDSSFTTAAAPQ